MSTAPAGRQDPATRVPAGSRTGSTVIDRRAVSSAARREHRPRLTVSVGVIMFVLGRLFHAVVALGPMVVGAVYGAALTRRGHRRRPLRTAVTAVTALTLVALGAVLTRPGSTAPFRGADGRPLAGSVAELARIRLGGHEQTVLLRGRSVDSPVLLYLAGGPGQSDLG